MALPRGVQDAGDAAPQPLSRPRVARAMEADRYPARPSELPREGARKCARLHALPTVPEEGTAHDEARVLPAVPEGAAVSGAVHALPAGAAVGGVGWGAVLAMQEADGDEAGAPAAEDGGWDDWMGDWDGGGGGTAEMEESGLRSARQPLG